MAPEKRFYNASQQPSTIVANRSTLQSDLYVIYEGKNPETGRPILKVFLNPPHRLDLDRRRHRHRRNPPRPRTQPEPLHLPRHRPSLISGPHQRIDPGPHHRKG